MKCFFIILYQNTRTMNGDCANVIYKWWLYGVQRSSWWLSTRLTMMTSSNGNIFCVTGLCVGNSLLPGEFPAQRPVMQNFDVFFDLCLNKWLSKQSWGWWFETLSRLLWRHRNAKLQCLSHWHEALLICYGIVLWFQSKYMYNACFIPFYNMVGVVVAMMISTMHEKSCIDSHNARKFE